MNSFVTRRPAGGHVKIVGLLLNKGADVNNIRDRGGNLPIHEACMGGHASVVQALVHAGSSLEAVRLSQTKGAEVRALVVAAMRAANRDEEAPAPVGYARKQAKSNAFFGAKKCVLRVGAQSAAFMRKDDCIEPGIV